MIEPLSLSWGGTWNEWIHCDPQSDYYLKKTLILGAKITLGCQIFSNKRMQEIAQRILEVFDQALDAMTILDIQDAIGEFYIAGKNWMIGKTPDAHEKEDTSFFRSRIFVHKGFSLLIESCSFYELCRLLTIVGPRKEIDFLIESACVIRDIISIWENLEAMQKHSSKGKDSSKDRLLLHMSRVAIASDVISIAVSLFTMHNLLIKAGIAASLLGVRFVISQKKISQVGIHTLNMISHLLAAGNSLSETHWKPLLTRHC